jgi:hypothetical protein
LVQRDAQRQFRRVMAVTLGAAIAVLAMAALLVMALRAQAEAQRQRAEAEGLVEYMLTDLRDKLKGVGRLDVMTAVNERAMGYYGDAKSLDGLSDESLERRARILHAMGEDDEKRGDLDKALAKFTEAHRTTAAILAKKPDNADAIFAHAQSEYWVGYANFVQKDAVKVKKAFAHFDAYRNLAYRLKQVDPKGSMSQREIGYAESNLCAVHIEIKSRDKGAEHHCQNALGSAKILAEKSRGDAALQLELANRYGWMADYYEQNADLPIARNHRQKQVEIISAMRAIDPNNSDTNYRLFSAQIGLARNQKRMGNLERYRQHIAAAKGLLASLRSIDSENTTYDKWEKDIYDEQ